MIAERARCRCSRGSSLATRLNRRPRPCRACSPRSARTRRRSRRRRTGRRSRAIGLEGPAARERCGHGLSQLRNDFSTPLVVLMCMVGLVLLIACANVANLLIAHGFMRQRRLPCVCRSARREAGSFVSCSSRASSCRVWVDLSASGSRRVDAGSARAHSLRRAAAADPSRARSPDPGVHLRSDVPDGHRFRIAAGVTGEQARIRGRR